MCGIVSTLDNGCCIGDLTIISVDGFEAGIIEVGNANGEALGDDDIDSCASKNSSSLRVSSSMKLLSLMEIGGVYDNSIGNEVFLFMPYLFKTESDSTVQL